MAGENDVPEARPRSPVRRASVLQRTSSRPG